MTADRAILYGAILGGVGVLMGAFGAHLLPRILVDQGWDPSQLARREAVFATGVRYQLFHAPVVILLGMLLERRCRQVLRMAAWALVAGVLLFSGPLYLLTFAGPPWRWLGAVVPIGGLLLAAGWAGMAWDACRR